MNENFFKPKFRIMRQYSTVNKPKYYIVSVKYWWLPIWFVAYKHIVTNDTRDTCGPAVFDNEDDAKDYIRRRYNAITFDSYDQI